MSNNGRITFGAIVASPASAERDFSARLAGRVGESKKSPQLALSRLSGYLAATSSSALPMPGTPAGDILPMPVSDSDSVSIVPAAPSSNELALDQRRSENGLRHEIQWLMSEADSRIEHSQLPSS